MTVTRVHSGHESHIEPPLDQDWNDLTKLRWHAAVTTADTGIQVRVSAANARVRRAPLWLREPGLYGLRVGGHSLSAMTFHEAWTFLSGVATGADAARADDAT